ncbi:MAG: GAF domain-containing protein [Candidatus Korobacteraceae bacterium]
MAVLQFIPDLPRSGNAGVDLNPEHQELNEAENAVREPAATKIFSPVITSPRIEPAVLMPFLNFAAQLALRSTGAAGCAIAMRAGAGFRCYASVGDAPAVDTPVRLAGTLTGLCVRKGKTIRRDDMANDETTELTGYAAHARSILLVPVFQDGNVGGVIGVFAPDPHYFLEEHRSALEHIAAVVGIAFLHPDRLEASSTIADDFAAAPPVQVVQESVRDNEQASRILEGLAVALTTAIMNAQRPALPAESPANTGPLGKPQKALYGLPCGKCGAYFPSGQSTCAVCGTPRGKKE